MHNGLSTQVDVSNRTVGGRRFALVAFSPPPGALLSWTWDALTALRDAVDSLDAGQVDAVAFTGEGAIFGAGADLGPFRFATSRSDGERIAREGYSVLDRISRLGLPTFAFINGTALGGALELALRADYRTVARSARSIGLPEVRLGLVPGWGGLSSLSELIGVADAADIAVTRSLSGRHLAAGEALRRGLVDVVLGDEDFVTDSLAWAAEVLAGTETPAPTAAATAAASVARPGSRPASWDPADVRAAVARRIPGAIPAVDAALTLLTTWQAGTRTAAETRGSAAGTAGTAHAGPSTRTEQRLAGGGDPVAAETIAAFGTLLYSDECRASIYAFYALQAARKRSRHGGSGESAAAVGVVGGGRMATQLALVFAERLDVPVLITDLTPDRVSQAIDCIADQLERAVARGTMTDAQSARVSALISGTTDVADLSGCDIVIEAVFEDLTVKRDVWASIEAVVKPGALLLTNTSSLSIADQGAHLLHPERLVGFHFFNPVAVLPLVEIVRAPDTSQETVEAAFTLAGRLGKTAVLVADSSGFVVNRLITRWFSDALALIDAGADAQLVDTALVGDGFPMTPLALIRHIGPAVQLHILDTMEQGFADRFTVSPSLRRIVQLSLPSYVGPDGVLTPAAAAAVAEILPPVDARPVVPGSQADVRRHLLHGLADEAGRMLAEGTVQTAADIDACMILGANYPHHTGGLTPLLDRSGASMSAHGVLFHPAGVATVATR
ncbi:3-hydroxyacyl-CoA dehydrogenase [Cryobacterium sp. TMT1-21]|uniref:3-hydroxyacyl-CoA dehydrogenase n=1 Tax=Cryobacterium shii TaxID=1259235 RepID=A0AAQ2C667_9MICO|nr:MULTISPECIES: 3-hydroxyacyl-CoA dehydrogenase NAD-binding domain-containing protein [Cryobacterium]TFC47098.1 3-hydroxyacyl-CoA dehydrogenase [Cryobacterium shii]TFC88203.1 3-hydroxyacyl-CoA dehydrogenase [Cryobacterium sp. TmT2-59]TFD13083.1 3-hydroxyacyl-CoA dehydrogenase [Cryobacterium sp. TMT4-10]TFD13823.1 3-hydroxyacyl-CoA dehydrogenase [Cryobacterium sp. TMT1-21]TFD16976.1 3-hydroxyacyl-CoA dehydrogenase [Cryobacterium sp. TMT2-23]